MTMLPAVTFTGAHLRILREGLGLGRADFADLLSTGSKMIANWESGRSNIPPGVIRDAQFHAAEMQRFVDDYVRELASETAPIMRTYSRDEDFRRDFPNLPYTAAWHRLIAARVRERVPGVRIIY